MEAPSRGREEVLFCSDGNFMEFADDVVRLAPTA